MRIVVLLVLLAGCGPPTAPDPLAARVWADYGMVGDPPDVTWRRGTALDCAAGRGWREATLDDLCVGGATWTPSWRSEVAAPEGVPAYLTALAHELNHARLYRLVGDPDAAHLDPSFGPGGRVAQENAQLMSVLGDAMP